MRLSERLLDYADAVVWNEETTESLLREAAEVIKRYEDAPVASVEQRSGGGPLVVSFLMDGKAYAGQRVRIVLDKEGV